MKKLLILLLLTVLASGCVQQGPDYTSQLQQLTQATQQVNQKLDGITTRVDALEKTKIETQAAESSSKTYVNVKYNYSVNIPKPWTPDGIGITEPDKNAADVSWSATGRFAPSFIDDANLTISVSPCRTTLAGCVNNFNKTAVNDAIVTSDVLSRKNAVQTKSLVLGNEAIDQTFTVTQLAGGKDETIGGRDIFFINPKNQMLYRISLWSHVYEKVDKITFDQILSSFSITQ